MDVAFDKWIPVVLTTGETASASLCEVLTEGRRFADLAVRPYERVSLMRLFLCVAHAALDGPKNLGEWNEVPERLPDAARAYLQKGRDSFELFHPQKPWLQVAGLKEKKEAADGDGKWTPVSKLVLSLATGNNPTLFDHEGLESGNRSIPLDQVVLSMLTYQCFSLGGTISQVYWEGTLTSRYSKDAPCAPASMAHALLRGRNIEETIRLNMPTNEDVRLSYGDVKPGRPVWEMVPRSSSDSARVENATRTYLGRLVPMTRVLLLHPSGRRMLMGDGLAYPAFADGFPAEPTATVVRKQYRAKEELAIVSYRPAKALWRELASFIVKRKSEGQGGPLALNRIHDRDQCDLVVSAVGRDKAEIADVMESVFHISTRLRSPEGTAEYESEVLAAETMESRLGWAVETYRREVDCGWDGRMKAAGPSKAKLRARLHATATTGYWTAVERNLPLLMRHVEAVGTDAAVPTRDTWRKRLFSAACSSYRSACGQDTPRQLRAFVNGWQKLIPRREEVSQDGES